MGCLKQIFQIIILIFAYMGFQSIGGVDFCMKKYDELVNPKQAMIAKEARKVADFSMLPDGYKLMRSFSFMGVKGVLANYDSNDQKCMLIDSKGLINIRKKDFYSDNIDNILSETISKIGYQAIRIEHFKVISNGVFHGLNQEIPYVIFESDVVGWDSDKMYGMFGLAQAPDGENDVVLSFSLDRTYDQLISEGFFKNISYKR